MPYDVGCETCKKRRIKCDGARPNCSRCRAANRICFPFPQKQTKFAFVVETFTPNNTVSPFHDKETRGEKEHAAVRERRSILKSQSSSRKTPRSWIHPSLTVPLEDQAIAYYFKQQNISSVEIIEAAQDHAKYFPVMWIRSQRDSAFCRAILAASYCAFGKARNNQAAMKASRFMYFQAISKITKSLLDPADSCSDQNLLATIVLSFYELASWDHGGGNEDLNNQLQLSQHKSRCFCHIDGATALLKARQERDPLSKRSLDLDKLVRRQVVRAALDRNMSVPAWLEDATIFGEIGLSLELDQWTIKTIRIQSEAQALSAAYQCAVTDEEQPSTTRLDGLIEEVNNLDNKALFWTTSLPPEWRYQRQRCESLRNTLYSSATHSYSSLSHAVIWNKYRSLRIILKSITIRLLRLLQTHFGHDTDVSIGVAISGIRDLVGDICASIPYFNSEVENLSFNSDGEMAVEGHEEARNMVKARVMSYLSSPLSIIINNFTVSGTSYVQQQWIRSRLLSIGRATNYGILEKLACT